MKQTRRDFLTSSSAAIGLAAGGSLLAAPSIAKDLKGSGQLNVFDGGGSWGAAKKAAYFEPFEKETGIKVVAQPRTDMGAIRASILAGAPRYDVAVGAAANAAPLLRDGLLTKIDYSWFEESDRAAFNPVPTAEYTVPHVIYSLLIAYDANKFPQAKPDSWADIWDVKKFPGLRMLPTGTLTASGAIFEAALLADGVAPKDLYPLDWDRAFKSLDKIKPNVLKWWSTGAEGPQLLIDRQAVAGSAWNGRISAAQEQGAKIGFTWNQGFLQHDTWYVPKGVKNTENAMKFLAFVSQAKVQAKFAELILYAPPNERAYDFLSSERAAQLPTFKANRDQQIPQSYEFWGAAGSGGVPNDKYALGEWEKWLAGAR